MYSWHCSQMPFIRVPSCPRLPPEGLFGYNSRMILTEIQQYIEARTHGEVLYPCYESYCLSKIPSTVLALLGIPQPDHALLKLVQDIVAPHRHPSKVVAILIDGFGWHQWLQYAEHYDFFNRVTTRGV